MCTFNSYFENNVVRIYSLLLKPAIENIRPEISKIMNMIKGIVKLSSSGNAPNKTPISICLLPVITSPQHIITEAMPIIPQINNAAPKIRFFTVLDPQKSIHTAY